MKITAGQAGATANIHDRAPQALEEFPVRCVIEDQRAFTILLAQESSIPILHEAETDGIS
jgi:hypothetical protein